MASWRNIKWDGNKTCTIFSYRVTQLGRALGLNKQHILDNVQARTTLSVFVNFLVYVDGMPAIFSMKKKDLWPH